MCIVMLHLCFCVASEYWTASIFFIENKSSGSDNIHRSLLKVENIFKMGYIIFWREP